MTSFKGDFEIFRDEAKLFKSGRVVKSGVIWPCLQKSLLNAAAVCSEILIALSLRSLATKLKNSTITGLLQEKKILTEPLLNIFRIAARR